MTVVNVESMVINFDGVVLLYFVYFSCRSMDLPIFCFSGALIDFDSGQVSARLNRDIGSACCEKVVVEESVVFQVNFFSFCLTLFGFCCC